MTSPPPPSLSLFLPPPVPESVVTSRVPVAISSRGGAPTALYRRPRCGVVRRECLSAAACAPQWRGAQRDRAVPGTPGSALAAGGVVARADPRPAREVGGGAEHGHVRPAFGEQHDRGPDGDAGNGAHPLQRCGKRCRGPVQCGVELGDGGVEEVDVGEHLRDQQTVVSCPESAGQGLAQGGDLRAQPAAGQLGQRVRVVLPGEKRLQDGPPGLGQQCGGDAGQLDPGVLHDLLQPLHDAGAFLDQGAAVPGQIAQLADRGWGYEAGPDQAVLDHLRDPRRVGYVGLAAGHVVHTS